MTSEIRTNTLTSRAGLSTVTLTDSGPMFSGITTFVDNSGFNLGTGSSIFSPASNTLTFGTNSNERLRITSSGNIGAGTNNPDGFYTHAKNLVIGSGSSGEGITIFSGSSDSGYIGFNDTVSNGMQGFIQYNHNGDYMAFGPNGTEKVRIGSSGQIGLSGANYGSSGQVLTSQGSSSAPTWSTITGTTINNNADNRVITGSGTANTLEADANLTWNNSTGQLVVGASGSGYISVRKPAIAQVDIQHSTTNSYCRLYMSQTSGSGGYFAINKLGTVDAGYTGGANAVQLWSSADAPMIFATNNAEKLRIASTGQVNIVRRNQSNPFPGGNGTFTGVGLDTDGGDLATGRIYIQGYQKNANSDFLTGFNNEGANLVLYDYSNSQYKQKWHKNGGTDLLHAGNTRLETTTGGINLTGNTDGVLNINTSDSRGSFIRFQQNGTTYNWIGCGQGLGGHNMNDLVLQSQKSVIIKGNAGAGSGQSIREIARFTTEGTTGGSLLIGTSVFGYQASNNTGHNLYYSEGGTANEGFPWYVIVGYTSSGGNNFGPWVVNRHPSYGNVRFYVQADGTIRNYNGINSLCDEREKNSIVDAPNAWDYVKNWRMRKFKYNKDGLNPQMKWGIVAQEFEQVNPELVDEEFCTEGNPNVDDTTGEMIFKEQYGDQAPTKRKSVNDRQMMMIAIKALQEAMTKIETLEQDNIALRARVTNLEGN